MRGSRFAAEAIGTFMLVVIGPGSAAVEAWHPGAVSPLGIALAFGFVILVGVYALGHVSGAHFNPAVTVAFWLSGRFPRRDVIPYVLAQLAAAVVGAALLRLLLGDAARAAATVSHVGAVPGLLTEVVLSFFLVLVIMAVATDARVTGSVAGVAVGLAIAFDAIMGGPLTGASMNPARSFGPAIITGVWADHWIYWVGPLGGAALAVPMYAYLRRGSSHDVHTRT